jgi:hypothetical protein
VASSRATSAGIHRSGSSRLMRSCVGYFQAPRPVCRRLRSGATCSEPWPLPQLGNYSLRRIVRA